PRRRGGGSFYGYRFRGGRGSLAAAPGGFEAIVSPAGIGETSAAIRGRVCRDAEWLGVALDRGANDRGEPRLSTPESRVAVWRIPTNEELMIARHTRRLISS